MDWIAVKGTFLEYLRKYKFIIIILLVGIMLLALPTEGKKEEPTAPVSQKTTLQESLEDILSKIAGAGRVSVLLTPATEGETLYQINENISSDGSGSSSRHCETVLVSGTGREESGLIRQVKAPTYLGAVVVCQGADNAAVRLAVVEAVRSATGLTSDRICVLKMK